MLSSKIKILGFPGDSLVKNPPSNAGDMGSVPDPVRSHMLWGNKAGVPQLLSPHPLEPGLCKKRRHQNEEPMDHNKE